jgi:putative membrane protein
VAPRVHKFAVVGDKTIHEKCGEAYWRRIVDLMREHFRHERFSDAIVDAIRDIGAVLATHFPKRSTSSNELPDKVAET